MRIIHPDSFVDRVHLDLAQVHGAQLGRAANLHRSSPTICMADLQVIGALPTPLVVDQ